MCCVSYYIGRQLFYIAILLHMSVSLDQTNKTQSKECVIKTTNPPPLTFSSLVSYQGSKNSFNPRHPTYKSNIVDFSFTTIDKLLRNSFISFDSDSIIKIFLNDKGITTIEDGAFNQLFCLHYLELGHNNISTLTNNVFEGLENLRDLNLSENLLEHVAEGSLPFRFLKRLEVLNLSRNRIRTIGPYAFINLTSLEVLDLGYNKLRILSPDVFSYLTSLKELYLNDNYLSDIEPEKWTGLGSLKVLNLAGNSLLKFDPSYNFSFSGLERLNLSNNLLVSLNVFAIRKQFRALKLIDITKNNLLCETFDVMKHVLADSNIVLAGVVECIQTNETYHQRTTEETTIHPTSTVPSVDQNVSHKTRDYSKDLFDQNGNILHSNENILNNIQHLENLVVYLFIIIVIFVVVDIAVRSGICGSVFDRLSGRAPRYLDSRDIENMALISPRVGR